ARRGPAREGSHSRCARRQKPRRTGGQPVGIRMMKHFVRAAFAAATLAAAVVVPSAGPAAAQQRTDVVLGMQVAPPGLDPRASPATAIGEIVHDNIMQGLVRLDRDGNIVPSLATAWTISDDGLTYTFQLR